MNLKNSKAVLINANYQEDGQMAVGLVFTQAIDDSRQAFIIDNEEVILILPTSKTKQRIERGVFNVQRTKNTHI